MPLPIDNDQASLALTQFLPLSGIYPSPTSDPGGIPLGSIRTFAGNFAFGGSFTAEGQLLPISQNTALFSLLNATYGGNGTSTFALPDLDGRTMIGAGQGVGLGSVQLGVPVGSSEVPLATAQLPASLGGTSQPFDNYQPSLPITYLIRTEGVFPSEGGGTGGVDFIGEIVPFAGTFVPGGFMEAAGQILQIADHDTLFQLIGTTYGGDGMTTFHLPDLRGRTIVGASAQLPIGTTEGQPLSLISNANLPVSVGGSGQPIDNHEPSLALTYLISLTGIFPSQNSGGVDPTEQYLGEVVAFAGSFAPKGWAKAEGQHLPINQNQALFSLLGTQYGGNGQTTFALPDLRDRTAIGTGDTAVVGETLGSNDTTVLSANIPDVHLTGTSAPNTLYGADGNDTLDGAGGADTMIGNLGNDVYFVDNTGDQTIENPGEGNDTVYATVHLGLSANVENLILQGGADLQGYGNGLVNALYGNGGNNILNGNGGADVMRGGAGNDAYFVDDGNDQVIENLGEGNDTVYAITHLALSANVENLILQGGADLQGYGNVLVNALYGNGGSNILNGNSGADVMRGGAGNDAYFVDDGSDQVIENAGEGNDTVYASVNFGLSANVENLILQGGADLQGYGNGLVNLLIGNTGSNLLNGGAGADTMRGGLGNDAYFVDDGNDQVIENPGEGNDTVYATVHLGLSANVENLILQGGADLQGYGNGLVNALYGNSGNNILNGNSGADVMRGGAGNDAYFVDDGNDQVIENPGEGNDTAYASVNFGLSANVENLILQGGADLQGSGNAFVNALYGNSGNNTLNGNGGADTMRGGVGNDAYFVDDGFDKVVENAGEGNDTIYAVVHFILPANVDNLVQQGSLDLGGTGNALVNGIFGNSGNNTLDGQGGADALTGNAGNDIFVFHAGQANGDTIVDFTGSGAATGDSFQFVGFGTSGATFTQVGVNQWQIHSGLDGHNEVITLSNGAAVDGSDFAFL
jgi:microcystin-dependent protein